MATITFTDSRYGSQHIQETTGNVNLVTVAIITAFARRVFGPAATISVGNILSGRATLTVTEGGVTRALPVTIAQ